VDQLFLEIGNHGSISTASDVTHPCVPARFKWAIHEDERHDGDLPGEMALAQHGAVCIITRMRSAVMIAILLASAGLVGAKGKDISVFIALCDNKTQGIIPVSAKIGNGDDPENNLYWGCDEGFPVVFGRSDKWHTKSRESNLSPALLRRMVLEHVDGDLTLTVNAYRGSEIKRCTEEFEMAVASGKYALVAYIGHNGLMDFELNEQPGKEPAGTDAIVLACASHAYFSPRLQRIGAHPILMTDQLMYPGSFILYDALEAWKRGGTPSEIRSAAGKAYARNQSISLKAALGIFSPVLLPIPAGAP
jgi:hypothetical protein